MVDELSENGCNVIESSDGNEALSHIKLYEPNLIITDLKMPGGGFEYLRNVAASVQNCPIILITAFGNSQTKQEAQACGVAAYFDKPVRVKDLKAALQQVCPVVKSVKPQTCQNSIEWPNS
ncbi:MAG: response regulator [Nitrospirales bacterium]|nr:MAG: response regulator [Nitrospirales bacterium]